MKNILEDVAETIRKVNEWNPEYYYKQIMDMLFLNKAQGVKQ